MPRFEGESDATYWSRVAVRARRGMLLLEQVAGTTRVSPMTGAAEHALSYPCGTDGRFYLFADGSQLYASNSYPWRVTTKSRAEQAAGREGRP
jgi:hypothetical protein